MVENAELRNLSPIPVDQDPPIPSAPHCVRAATVCDVATGDTCARHQETLEPPGAIVPGACGLQASHGEQGTECRSHDEFSAHHRYLGSFCDDPLFPKSAEARCAKLGLVDRVGELMRRMAAGPEVSVGKVSERLVFAKEVDSEHLAACLRLAGLPEVGMASAAL